MCHKYNQYISSLPLLSVLICQKKGPIQSALSSDEVHDSSQLVPVGILFVL